MKYLEQSQRRVYEFIEIKTSAYFLHLAEQRRKYFKEVRRETVEIYLMGSDYSILV